MIYIYTGLPGSGKTLKLAKVSLLVLRRNKRYYNKLIRIYEKEIKVWLSLVKKGMPPSLAI